MNAKMAFILVALSSSLACDGETSPTDASADGGADGGSLAAPPEIPWLESGMPFTSLEPCPEGYRLDTEQMPAECDPYPAAGPEACDAGEAHFPGEAGCRPIGTPCPSGDFAEDLPTDGPTIYVSASAAPGGDGSLAAPFARIGDVSWSSLPGDAIVALGKGRYEGVLALKAGVRVYGACAAETILTGVDAPVSAVVMVTTAGDPALVANLAISGPPQYGVLIESGRSLRLEGVHIEQTVGAAVAAAEAGSLVTAEDLVIEETFNDGGDVAGHGLWAQLGARIEGVRVLVSRSGLVGALSAGEGAVVSLTDSVIRDARGAADGSWGRGVSAQTGGRFEGTRVLIEDNRDVGLIAAFAGEVVLEDVIIRNTRSNELTGGSGRAISVQDGSRLTADRLVLAESRDAATLITDPETLVVLRNTIIRDTNGADGDGTYGRAITGFGGSRLEATNLVVLRSRDTALFVEEGSTGVLEDVAIADVLSQRSGGDFGRGLAVQDGASIEASRVLIERSHEHAIVATGVDATATLRDVVIRDTSPLEELTEGVGLAVQNQARATGNRIAMADVRGHGVAAIHEGIIELEDLRIVRVFESRSPVFPFGHGAGALDGRLRLTRFEIVSPDYCGVFLAQGDGDVEVDLAMGRVEGARIGVCIQAPDYDLTRLMESVEYTDNGTNLDTTSLPVPMPAAEIEGF